MGKIPEISGKESRKAKSLRCIPHKNGRKSEENPIHHSKFGKITHTDQQCRLNKHMKGNAEEGAKKAAANRKFNKKKPEVPDLEEDSDTDDQIQEQQRKGEQKFPKVDKEFNLTFLATPPAKKLKQAWREINATVPAVPKRLRY